MAIIQRNNLDIYNDVAADWWSDDIRWVRTTARPFVKTGD